MNRRVVEARQQLEHPLRQLREDPCQPAILDQAMIALLEDRQAKGLLDQTLVVLESEFGRTPRINDNDGRDKLRLRRRGGRS